MVRVADLQRLHGGEVTLTRNLPRTPPYPNQAQSAGLKETRILSIKSIH